MRTILFILISIVGLTMTFLGLTMIGNPHWNTSTSIIDNVGQNLLRSLFVPGLILSILGLVNIAAIFSAIQRGSNQYNWALASGILLSMASGASLIIGFFHFVQIILLVIGILIILLSYQLKGRWAA